MQIINLFMLQQQYCSSMIALHSPFHSINALKALHCGFSRDMMFVYVPYKGFVVHSILQRNGSRQQGHFASPFLSCLVQFYTCNTQEPPFVVLFPSVCFSVLSCPLPQSIDPGQQFTWENSNMEVNKPKNRYANVIAYDHSRVVLTSVDGKSSSKAT